MCAATDKVEDDYTFLRFDTSVSRFGSKKGDALYMNAYLFGNIGCSSNSTLHLLLSDYDYSNKLFHTFTAEYLCKQLKLETYFHLYKAEFKKLKELHKAAGIQGIGNLLMISVDPTQVYRVYSAGAYADQKVLIRLSNGSETAEVKKIIDDLRTGKLKNFDHLQCVLPLTKDYALDPKKGPRIYSFTACDPVKRKAFEDFGAQLFAKIAADIAADKNR